MITRETVINEIQKMPEPYLEDLYEVIKGFEAARMIGLTEKKQGAVRLGVMEGVFEVPDNFDDPLPEDLMDGFSRPENFTMLHLR